MSTPKENSPSNRIKVINELMEHLGNDSAPREVIELWKIQSDTCYCAYVAGKAAARRMFLEGDIEEDRIVEVALEFAKLLVMKITFAPNPPPSAGIVVPKLLGIPGTEDLQ